MSNENSSEYKKPKKLVYVTVLCIALLITVSCVSVYEQNQLTNSYSSDIKAAKSESSRNTYDLVQALFMFSNGTRVALDNSWHLNQTNPVTFSATIAMTANVFSNGTAFCANLIYTDGTVTPAILLNGQQFPY